jgi:octaprenyl-diphosphate synthase
MRIQDVFQRYEEPLKQVEEFMASQLDSEVRLIPEMIGHLIGSGGKRFRPLLLLVSADLCGYHGERAATMASVVEFIHTATLLHDDVVDAAETRRGKTSANHLWGNAASVLVGDFLYSKAFTILTGDGNLAIMKLLATSTNAMSEGEVFQLVRMGDPGLTEKEYLSVVEKKTSILISAACAIGGILGNASPEKIQALTRFGLKLGTAFQITDDILDYDAKEGEFGKAIGKDLLEGKVTLPLIRTLKKSPAPEKQRIRAYLALCPDARRETHEEIMALVAKGDSLDYCRKKARAYLEEAKALLGGFPESPPADALTAIADYILARRL